MLTPDQTFDGALVRCIIKNHPWSGRLAVILVAHADDFDYNVFKLRFMDQDIRAIGYGRSNEFEAVVP